MIREKNLNNRLINSLLFLLIFISFLVNLGLFPFYHEEPRRALITLEMIFSGNYMVPTYLGEYYYKKPPVFNWILALSYSIFDNYSEFATRIITPVSNFLMGIILYFVTRKYINHTVAILSALLFLVSAHTYFYESLLAEIDLFYCLITFLGLLTIFHFHQKQKYFLLFTTTYILHAIGTLTKGFPSILIVGLSLLSYFIVKKDVRKLFSFNHLFGIILYVLIISIYLLIYAQYNSLEAYINGLWGQSSEMTLLENRFITVIKGLFTYPFSVWKDNLPASLLIIFFFRKDFLQRLKSNPLVLFGAVIFVANIWVYWISPKSAPRYTIMFNPFLVVIFVYFMVDYYQSESFKTRIIEWISGILILLLLGATIAINFIEQVQVLDHVLIISIVLGILQTIVFILYLKRRYWRLQLLIVSLILTRFLFDLIALPLRATISNAQQDKTIAYEITEITGDEDLYILEDTQFSQTTYFYLERERKKILNRISSINQENWYLAEQEMVINFNHETFMQFRYRDQDIVLIKFR